MKPAGQDGRGEDQRSHPALRASRCGRPGGRPTGTTDTRRSTSIRTTFSHHPSGRCGQTRSRATRQAPTHGAATVSTGLDNARHAEADGPPRGASEQAWRPRPPGDGSAAADDPTPTIVRDGRPRASGGTADEGRQRSSEARSPHPNRRDLASTRMTAQRRAGFPRGRPATAGTEPSGRLETRDRLTSDGERSEAGRRSTLRTVHTGWSEQDGRSGFGSMKTSVAGMHHPETGRRHRDTDGGVMTVGATRSEATQAPESAERSRVQDRAAHERRGQGRTHPRGGEEAAETLSAGGSTSRRRASFGSAKTGHRASGLATARCGGAPGREAHERMGHGVAATRSRSHERGCGATPRGRADRHVGQRRGGRRRR